jgi:hypothetical protein
MTWASLKPLLAVLAGFSLGGCSDAGPTSLEPADESSSEHSSGPQFSHSASENTGTFDWFFGTAFPFFAAGPSVSRARDGSRIEISGSGSFSIGEGPKSISGGGTFQIFDSENNLVASGSWTATHLRGFVDYGGFPPPNDDLRGGTLEVEINLAGPGQGSLWIICVVGEPPPSKSEGVLVKVGRWHFDEIAPGNVNIFIRT